MSSGQAVSCEMAKKKREQTRRHAYSKVPRGCGAAREPDAQSTPSDRGVHWLLE